MFTVTHWLASIKKWQMSNLSKKTVKNLTIDQYYSNRQIPNVKLTYSKRFLSQSCPNDSCLTESFLNGKWHSAKLTFFQISIV